MYNFFGKGSGSKIMFGKRGETKEHWVKFQVLFFYNVGDILCES